MFYHPDMEQVSWGEQQQLRTETLWEHSRQWHHQQSPQGNVKEHTPLLRKSPLISSKRQKTRLGFTKKHRVEVRVMEKPKCGEGNDLHLIQNLWAHGWSMVVAVPTWLGLTWMLLEHSRWSLPMMELMIEQQNGLQKHSVCLFTKKCSWCDREALHHVAGQRAKAQNTLQHNKVLNLGKSTRST